MDQNSEGGCLIMCSVKLEWFDVNGCITRMVNHKIATLRLIRNNLREILVEVREEKTNTAIKLILRKVLVFNRFVSEGKASIKFQEDRCTLFMSNAPVSQLMIFLKMIFVKMSAVQTNKSSVPSLKEKLLSNIKKLENDISPATIAELQIAREKAANISRSTVTTPSPKNIRKRKFHDDNAPKFSTAKKLNMNNSCIDDNIMTEEQREVLNAVLAGKNVFFTGSAGTGKSFLLRRIIAGLPPNVTVATASTGVAACHIGGMTLHQFAGIGLGTSSIEACYKKASKSSSATLWRKIEHLVIDEISMIDADYFEKVEAVARYFRKKDKPFGGIQLILCGDFFQLPPVAKRESVVKFCFQSKAWMDCIQVSFELRTIHRQKDPAFIEILNSVRIGKVNDEIAEKLRATRNQKIESNGILATRLCSHIDEANNINETQLEKLPGERRVFIAEDSDETMRKFLDDTLPVSSRLVLKVGAQVMLLKNINVNNGLVNGARGVVVKFSDGIPIVQFRSGKQYQARMEIWSSKTANGVIIQRKQIPLKLAWAFSIHKSQGLTLDCVEMNLSRVFDAGQAYVALSRAQSLESLRILDFNIKQVWANPEVLRFYRNLNRYINVPKYIPLGKKAHSIC